MSAAGPGSPYISIPFERFPALNLFEDAEELGPAGAVVVSNVAFDRADSFRTRDGSSAVSAAAATGQFASMAYYKDASGVEWIVAVDVGVGARPIKLSDGSFGTTGVGGQSNNAYARFGDPSNTVLYVASSATGTSTSPLQRYNGSTWASLVAPIQPSLAAVTASDNRLVIAAGDSPHRVQFSDAGAPESWGTGANHVDLWPGDGEVIRALVRYRNDLLAFKQTKFAVFTGVGTEPDGSPEFVYHGIDAGAGVFTDGMAVAGNEGVYFATATGIYLTTGGPPAYISRPLEPWLVAGSYTGLPAFSLSAATMAYHDRRLYIFYPNGASSTTLVYDPAAQTWSVWQMGALNGCSVPASSSRRGLYFSDNTSKKLAKLDPATTTDQGAAIAWSYQSGYYAPPGAGGRRVKLRGSSVWGTATNPVTLQVLTQGGRVADVADPGGTVTLGASPTVAEGKRRRSTRGVLFAHKLSGTGPATISRLTHRFLPPGFDS
jgi:hypothetical protein